MLGNLGQGSKGGKHDKKNNKNDKGKDKGPTDGLTGGRPPHVPVCDSIPGCQYCPFRGRCQQCLFDGYAKFIRNGRGGCECPPGYGRLQNSTQPPLTRDAPWWADMCLPCPRNASSPGGPIGRAQCQPCRSGTATGKGKGWSACLVSPTCSIGQQPAAGALGCMPCPIGTFQPAAGMQGCLPCPANYTTAGTGSTSILECIVPVCPPGSQLVKQPNSLTGGFGYWCINCSGLDYSIGGLPEQGENQRGLCQPCPPGQVPNLTRNACYNNICPPPDAFFISCNSRFLPANQIPCSALSGPVSLDSFCSAYPLGAQLTWFKGSALNPLTPVFGSPLNPAIIPFPCDDSGTDFYYPFITSWQGFRQDCLCVSGQTNCYFSNGVFQPGVTGTPNTLGNPVVSLQVIP
ncbi:hypothetical protein OEZ86_008127 [Tetradesmus obliquus]|nr:hypothetical protein OEZ86_008127 [Tetradesmus obliquus]